MCPAAVHAASRLRELTKIFFIDSSQIWYFLARPFSLMGIVPVNLSAVTKKQEAYGSTARGTECALLVG